MRKAGRAVLLSVIAVASLLVVFAYVIASSQSTSRHEAQQRFQAQATIAAGLTDAIFSTLDDPAQLLAAKTLGGKVTTAQLDRLARQSNDAYALVTAANGSVLVSSAAAPRAPLAKTPAVALALEKAEAGRVWYSDVYNGQRGMPLVAEMIPFPTASGQRIEVLGAPAGALFAFFSSFLKGSVSQTATHALMLDGAARILGSSVTSSQVGKSIVAVKPGQRAGAALLAVLHHAGNGAYATTSGQRYVVTAPVVNSDWRVAITAPTDDLYTALVGSRRWVLWTVFAAFALAGAVGIVLLARVLSSAAIVADQSAALEDANAALMAANAELDAFSYSVSHDLRAPLRAIDGFSRIVVDEDVGQLSDEQHRYLGLVRDNTHRMSELIDDLLALSRLASRPLVRQIVDMNELVAEVRESLQPDLAGRDVRIVAEDLPPVHADPVLVRQVLQNLLGNAVKYSRERSPGEIRISSGRSGDQVEFIVRDNGVGFDMRYADKLFEVFQRLHLAEDYDGTGVGLAIVRRIVERHGGRVWATSSPGQGASFHFTLGADAT